MSNETETADEPRFRLSDIYRTMREGVLILGKNMRISASNDVAEEAFSRFGEELRNRRLSEVLRDFALHEAFSKAINEKASTEVRVELIGDKGRIFDVLVSPLDLGSENAAIGVFYEVTRVERLERVRQEFLSNISHELRTPLTSILAFVETLEDGAIDDRENNRRFLEVIRKNAERMHLLIDDFSELSSIESGNVSVEPGRINLCLLVSEILTSLSTLAEAREIELISGIPEDVYIYADAVRFQQMLTNLVDNGIKFNRREGSVTIAHSVSGDRDLIMVIDTGEGISKEHQQRIFERFYRIDKARSRTVGGTGLGLSIVKHLARLHGGEVTVNSKPNNGTTFCISLPTEPHAAAIE